MSGSHINPAVTVGFVVSGQMPVVRAILYILVQCLGAVAGTAGLKVFLHESHHGLLCHLYLDPSITVLHGVLIEFFLTFLLMLTVLAVSDENKSGKHVFCLSLGHSLNFQINCRVQDHRSTHSGISCGAGKFICHEVHRSRHESC